MNNPTKSVPYVIKPDGAVTLYLKGECQTVDVDHPNYNKVLDCIKKNVFDGIDELVNVAKAVTSYGRGKIQVKNGQVFYGTYLVHNTLTQRILKMMNEGFKVDSMVKFLENLMENPSNRAVNETYTFLENYGLPLTEDGCFLAYKAVRNDYKDIYSGTFDNSIGQVVSMPRNQVDERYEIDCSKGLHVGALDYVVQYGHFTKDEAVNPNGNRLLIVKVNPKDVVSVPRYENHPKMRVAEYVVISEIRDVVKELDKAVYKSDATEMTPDEDQINEEVYTQEFGSEAYNDGFQTGRQDRTSAKKYGSSRDYSVKGDYLKGYNDGYNLRDYNYETDEECGCNCNECSCQENDIEESEYESGYELGKNDADAGLPYQESLDIDDSTVFKKGYQEGYEDNYLPF